MSIAAAAVGGYDDNLTAGGGKSLAQTAMVSGSTASANGTLAYYLGNSRRFIRAQTTSTVVSYPQYIPRPLYGATGDIEVSNSIGRDWTVGASERVGFQPVFSVLLGSAGLPSPDAAIGATSSATGLFERRAWSSDTSVSLRRWSGRGWTSISYDYGRRTFTRDDYGDGSSHTIFAAHRYAITPRTQARFDYRYFQSAVT